MSATGKTLDDVVVELSAIRQDMGAIQQQMVTRSEHEEFRDELLRALAGISQQQTSFITLATRLLNDREEADRRFAKLEAAVFGSKH